MTCTLDALSLADLPPFMVTVGDLCSVCHGTDACLKVATFLPVGRSLNLAAEYRACPRCESICIDAAHAAAVDQSKRHLVRTLTLPGHRDRDERPIRLARVVICDTTAVAA